MRKWLIALMVVLSAALGAVVVGIRMSADKEGPEIIFASDKSTSYIQNMDMEQLLGDVKAVDNRDGDVSNTLTVEKVYEKNAEEVVVVYVAKDSSNNVSKKDFTMQIVSTKDEGSSKEETIENPEEEESQEDLPQAEDETEAASETDAEEAESELSKEEEARKTQEEKIELLSSGAPRFYLTTYYLEIPVGTNIDKLSFVSDIQDDADSTNDLFRKIQVNGEVDVNTPGTYEVTYYVIDSVGNMSNEAVLTVEVQ